jgi:uncharacterized protein YukE
MSIELPQPVVDFLNLVGVVWPPVNEDSVREFAGHVRDFATNMRSTHEAATSTIQQMSSSYSGTSYEQLVATWAQMSNSHMQELQVGATVVADALDVAADVIVGLKVAAIAQLSVMAASFVADQAAAVATFGAAEAAELAIIEGAKLVVKYLEQEVVQHILGEVIGKAVLPLEGVVAKAVSGLTFSAAAGVLGVGTGGQSAGSGTFSMVPQQLLGHAETLQGHADTIAGHAQDFVTRARSVSFA